MAENPYHPTEHVRADDPNRSRRFLIAIGCFCVAIACSLGLAYYLWQFSIPTFADPKFVLLTWLCANILANFSMGIGLLRQRRRWVIVGLVAIVASFVGVMLLA